MSQSSSSKPATKVVVRFLPPELSEQLFFQNILPHHKDSIVWHCFVKGKKRKTIKKSTINSRAYMNFSSPASATDFIDTFHGTSFVDDKGEIYKAVACYAPYPQVPRANVPVDKKKNTMETDPIYLEFLESLNKKPTKPTPQDVNETGQTSVISPLVLEISQRRKKSFGQQKQGREKKKKPTKIQLKETQPQHTKRPSLPSLATDTSQRVVKSELQNPTSRKMNEKTRHRERKERPHRVESAAQGSASKLQEVRKTESKNSIVVLLSPFDETPKHTSHKDSVGVQRHSESRHREIVSSPSSKSHFNTTVTKRHPITLLKRTLPLESKTETTAKIPSPAHPIRQLQHRKENTKQNSGIYRFKHSYHQASPSTEKIDPVHRLSEQNSFKRKSSRAGFQIDVFSSDAVRSSRYMSTKRISQRQKSTLKEGST